VKQIPEVVEKTVNVVFKYCPEPFKNGRRRAEYRNAPSATPILFKDDVNVVILLGVFLHE
jgi:hypothetical protein